jgi:branched-chain amino acid transport system permease protein
LFGLIEVLIGGLIQGGVYAAIALGFSLVFRVTGVVNLAQGAFSVFGAMGMYFFQVKFGLPIPVAVILALIATSAFAAFVGATTFVPAVMRLPISNTLMLTAGLLTFFEGVTLVVLGQSTLRSSNFFR